MFGLLVRILTPGSFLQELLLQTSYLNSPSPTNQCHPTLFPTGLLAQTLLSPAQRHPQPFPRCTVLNILRPDMLRYLCRNSTQETQPIILHLLPVGIDKPLGFILPLRRISLRNFEGVLVDVSLAVISVKRRSKDCSNLVSEPSSGKPLELLYQVIE